MATQAIKTPRRHLPLNPVDIFGMGSRAVDFMKRSQAARKPFSSR